MTDAVPFASLAHWVMLIMAMTASALGTPGVHVEALPAHQPPVTHLLGPVWQPMKSIHHASVVAACIGKCL